MNDEEKADLINKIERLISSLDFGDITKNDTIKELEEIKSEIEDIN